MERAEQSRVSDILLHGHWYRVLPYEEVGSYRELGDGRFEALLGEFPDRSGARLTPAWVVGNLAQVSAWRFETDVPRGSVPERPWE